MLFDPIVKLQSTVKIMENESQVIVCNRLNGQWVKMPKDCYDIIKISESNGITVSEMYQSLFDDEDREYMKSVIGALKTIAAMQDEASTKAIDSISISLTHRCNLNCIHCMVAAQYGGGSNEIFDTDRMCEILTKIVKTNPKSIVLTGGEPLLRNDFIELLMQLRAIYAGQITIMTNGTLFTEKNIKEIVRCADSIDISLDGADEESCAIIRGRGVFGRVIKAIELLHLNKFDKISLSMILSMNNVFYHPLRFLLYKHEEAHRIDRK